MYNFFHVDDFNKNNANEDKVSYDICIYRLLIVHKLFYINFILIDIRNIQRFKLAKSVG